MAKYWESFKTGEKFSSQAVTVTEAHLVNWASLSGDWFQLHTDEEYAKKTQFKGRIAHGPLIFALSLGLITRTGYVEDAIMWLLGIDKLKAVAPVKIGDTIHTEAEFINKRETHHADKGIITMKHSVKNQRDELVMEYEITAMFHRAP
jgi:acyl dehydratase